jgi:hypothetical protein
MSFNIGSLLGNVLPLATNLLATGALSSPQGALFAFAMQGLGGSGAGADMLQGLGLGNNKNISKLVGSLAEKMAGLFMTGSSENSDGQNVGRRRRRRIPKNEGNPRTTRIRNKDMSEVDTSQSKINSILNSDLSIEEKIIMIAGVVCDSVTEQLEDKLKEQGKLAKKLDSKSSSSAGDAPATQNVENKIQLLMQRLNRMQTLTSNMIQALHTTKKAQIMNIRV